jgi:uncharacterized protein (DUF1015 family)
MPKILPFRATRYRVPDLAKVLTQPYDRIDEALQADYLKRSPHNAVRLILGAGDHWHGEADGLLKRWLAEGVLATEEKPCLYPYLQIYQTPYGQRVRRGLVARVEINEYGQGKIRRHEHTQSGPKADRLRLVQATRTHFGQIFLLYSDPKKQVTNLMAPAVAAPPLMEARDDFGNLHRVWRIDAPDTIRRIQRALERLEAIIADGHHRYETAVNYWLQSGGRRDGPERTVMATLVNTEEEGLTIYPTHRIVHGLPSFDPLEFSRQLNRWFEVRAYPFADPAAEPWARQEFVEDVRIEGFKLPTLGLVVRGAPAYAIAMLTDPARIRAFQDAKRSEAWRRLDVNILHDVVLHGLLGITPEDLAAQRYIRYAKTADEVIEGVRRNGGQVGFLVNPVGVDQVKAVVQAGETFPQKTTDFYPKLLTGLLLYRLDDNLK